MPVMITITAKGETASGKSLAIADMINGLHEGEHFHIERKIIMTTNGEEYQEIEVRLKHHMLNPIEHEDL